MMHIENLSLLKWIGAGLGMIGALMIAMNVSGSGYGFVVFSFSSICWMIVGWRLNEPSIIVLNISFLAINMLGIYRWLLV